VCRMVASIEKEYIEELDNKYTGYNNETLKSILAHLAAKYCKATVANQLKTDGKFAKPWDQVTNLGTWITQLEILRRKCEEVDELIDNKQMVLKIRENAKKCALFTSVDHKAYNDLPNYHLDMVTKFWVKKYKLHNTYNCPQAITNEYKSTAYAGHQPMLPVPLAPMMKHTSPPLRRCWCTSQRSMSWHLH
jgi:hypothetical protein